MRGSGQSGNRRRLALHGENFAFFGKAQRKGANARKQIGNALDLANGAQNMRSQGLFARLRGLQKAPRRRDDLRHSHSDLRRTPLDQDKAMIGQSRQISLCRSCNQTLAQLIWQFACAMQIKIKARIGRCHHQIQRLAMIGQNIGNQPCRRQSVSHAGRENGALSDGQNLMRARLHKANKGARPPSQTLIKARMKGRASTPLAMRINQRSHSTIDSNMCQRRNDKIAFPLRIRSWRQRLHSAAATMAEMRTQGRNAIGTGNNNFSQTAAIAIHIRNHHFARQSIGHKDKAAPIMGQPGTFS